MKELITGMVLELSKRPLSGSEVVHTFKLNQEDIVSVSYDNNISIYHLNLIKKQQVVYCFDEHEAADLIMLQLAKCHKN
ncbi:hypothetical protein SAMN05443252_107272 [Bacillus sp. OV322]|uniref:hypothetical protein n=1 Tax=Bacillus sp. OV322 TaxID=1882764 RepID=UPI0008EDD174|nr:hypothetical protein [Bacillus sp. OV322]SFC88837.1 hypothetical protein SAMN05443252_107272 [Bacillus sp. OV322]